MEHNGKFILNRQSGQFPVRRYTTDSQLIFFESDSIMGLEVYINDEWWTLHYHPGQSRDAKDAFVQLARIALQFRNARPSPMAAKMASERLVKDITDGFTFKEEGYYDIWNASSEKTPVIRGKLKKHSIAQVKGQKA